MNMEICSNKMVPISCTVHLQKPLIYKIVVVHCLSVTCHHQTEKQLDTRMKVFPLLYLKSTGLR